MGKIGAAAIGPDELGATKIRAAKLGPAQIGSRQIGTGEISGFLAVMPEAFAMDVYTEAYVAVKGAEEETLLPQDPRD